MIDKPLDENQLRVVLVSAYQSSMDTSNDFEHQQQHQERVSEGSAWNADSMAACPVGNKVRRSDKTISTAVCRVEGCNSTLRHLKDYHVRCVGPPAQRSCSEGSAPREQGGTAVGNRRGWYLILFINVV